MKRFGLIGHPLTHSFSAQFFSAKFHREGISARYDLLPIQSLQDIEQFVAENQLDGFNVTVPHKKSIVPFLNHLSDDARKVGAVNCVKVTRAGWFGHNTDIIGVEGALHLLLGKIKINRALILGNGGSAAAVCHVLDNLGIGYRIVSRKGALNYENITHVDIQNADLIVNTTPLGMYPETSGFPQIPYDNISEKHFALDLIYNPTETVFLQKCRLQGAKTQNGQLMLELQAEASWQIWSQD